MRLYKLFIITMLLLCPMSHKAQTDVTERLAPTSVAGVKNETISLNGTWDFQFTPTDKWEKVIVPGELAMQGYAIEHDKPVTYRKTINIPSDFKGKTVILRFDGVYSYSRLWVNGKYVREHHGGFTRWENDITALIKPGKKNEIKLEVTDKLDDISYASGYAHHPIGGILRDVTLYAIPQAHMQNVFVTTDLDDSFSNAKLNISYSLTEDAEVAFSLTSPEGKNIHLTQTAIKSAKGINNQSFDIESPELWAAEHPNLYLLKMTVKSIGDSYSAVQEIGFRKIEIKGNRMLVNGKQVKLRGACRHDMHPTLGRIATAETDSLDAILFKRANMNFVRTSHYPPTERFLKLCNRYGIYVECETAICFVDTHRQKNYSPARSQNDPEYTDRYMSQLKEMIYSFRSNPSVLFWSVGNESMYGENFQKSYDWAKAADHTRPAVFSYPGTVPENTNVYDILSMHYPGCDGTMWQYGLSTYGFQTNDKPALFDEWAHVPCYTYTTLQDDPNIRDFWGISLDKMWSTLFNAQGGLGGAIWGYIDETFMLPQPKKGQAYWTEFARTSKPENYTGKCVGYGEWGIVDVWRREKPEFWNTKKAYSPVRLITDNTCSRTAEGSLLLTLHNRFDHTNTEEIEIYVTDNGKKKRIASPSIEPHEKGMLEIPAENCNADTLLVEFFDRQGMLIDAESIVCKPQHNNCEKRMNETSETLQIAETEEYVTVTGNGFTIPFNKKTGLMENVTSHGKTVIRQGPFLNLDLNVSHKTGPEVREKASNYIVNDNDWSLTSFGYTHNDNKAYFSIEGKYLGTSLKMNICLYASGEMTIDYRTEGEPNGWLREAGLKFHIADTFTAVEWQRDGYWSWYPENSFAGNKGKAPLYNNRKVEYGQKPEQDWNMDTHNYYYFADRGAVCNRPLTNQAKGMKENIYSYRLTSSDSQTAIEVESHDASMACRINKTGDDLLILYANNRWDYPEIAWGDYCKALEVTPVYGTVRIKL